MSSSAFLVGMGFVAMVVLMVWLYFIVGVQLDRYDDIHVSPRLHSVEESGTFLLSDDVHGTMMLVNNPDNVYSSSRMGILSHPLVWKVWSHRLPFTMTIWKENRDVDGVLEIPGSAIDDKPLVAVIPIVDLVAHGGTDNETLPLKTAPSETKWDMVHISSNAPALSVDDAVPVQLGSDATITVSVSKSGVLPLSSLRGYTIRLDNWNLLVYGQ